MSLFNSDHEWEKWGKSDPFFGVLSNKKFRSKELNDASVSEFYASGNAHLEKMMATIRRHYSADFAPKRCLDFGCGVGRILLPLARLAQTAIGVDISPSMLEKATARLKAEGLSNTTLITDLKSAEGLFDLVHTYIVLQHIPPARGMNCIRQLLNMLAPGGIAVIQFTFGNAHRSRFTRMGRLLRYNIPLAHNVINILKGHRFSAPLMQVNSYNLNRVFMELYSAGVSTLHTEFTNHGGDIGVQVFCTKI